MSARALIVDDVRAECTLISDALLSFGFESDWVLSAGEALERLTVHPFDVVLTDLNMPGMNGIDLCRRITETQPNLPVVVVTAFGTIDSAVQAMRAGAYDFITKPFDIEAAALILKRAVEHYALHVELATLRRVADTFRQNGELLGTSQAMRNLQAQVKRLATSRATALITGESGTGKELTARELHRLGDNPNAPFTVFHCYTVPEPVLERELFGTSAGDRANGASAPVGALLRGGTTVLLDEVADLPQQVQLRLSKLLHEREFDTAGSANGIQALPRVLVASSRDLEVEVQDGHFLAALYHQVSVNHIECPPLRERGGDILLLTQSLLVEIATRNQLSVKKFTTRACEKLLAYDWPGNVRELKNCVERAVALAPTDIVDVEHLPPKVRDHQVGHFLIVGDNPSELLPLEALERKYIMRVLEICQGNKSRAARILGIGRKTLYRKLVGFGLDMPDDDAEAKA